MTKQNNHLLQRDTKRSEDRTNIDLDRRKSTTQTNSVRASMRVVCRLQCVSLEKNVDILTIAASFLRINRPTLETSATFIPLSVGVRMAWPVAMLTVT